MSTGTSSGTCVIPSQFIAEGPSTMNRIHCRSVCATCLIRPLRRTWSPAEGSAPPGSTPVEVVLLCHLGHRGSAGRLGTAAEGAQMAAAGDEREPVEQRHDGEQPPVPYEQRQVLQDPAEYRAE